MCMLVILCIVPTADAEETSEAPDASFLRIGGALRYNLLYTIYEGETAPLGTAGLNDVTWDMWRLEALGRQGKLDFSFQYRFYPSFNTHFIHHGWLGWSFTAETQLQLGVTQVPFGMLPYASHSWWFQLPYYAGLEDDYDMGLKLTHRQGPWDFALAYFILAEPRGTSDPAFGPYSAARYSYDVVPVPGESNIERHQTNARMAYDLSGFELGLSGQLGEIYNLATGHGATHWAAAAHIDGAVGPFGLKTQYLYYEYAGVEDDEQNALDVIQMGAYGFGTYDVAARAHMLLLGLSYSLDVSLGPITSIMFYDDYTFMAKGGEFENTHQNVLGALISAGPVFIYADVASGKNHPWLSSAFGGPALGAGRPLDVAAPITPDNPLDSSPGWNTRLNINLGYYF